jgi:hypothetical protein
MALTPHTGAMGDAIGIQVRRQGEVDNPPWRNLDHEHQRPDGGKGAAKGLCPGGFVLKHENRKEGEMRFPRIPILPLPGGLGIIIKVLTIMVLALTVQREIKEIRREREQEDKREKAGESVFSI